MQEGTKNKLLIILSLLGFTAALLVGMSEHIQWLQLLCTGFSDGCRETARLTLFRVPLWGWGMAYYALLVLCILRARHWVGLLIPSGVGIEIGLLWIIITTKVLCVYCLGNLIVITLLIVFSFERSRFWQTLSLSLLFFIFSFFVIPHENELRASSPIPVPVKEGQKALAAKVGDRLITDEELTMTVVSKVRELEHEIYRVKQQRLDQMILDILLQKEAAQRGMPLDQFINGDILAKAGSVSEAEIDRYIQENQNRIQEWKGSMEDLRGRIRVFLDKQRNVDKVLQFARSLKPKYGVEIYLQEPESITAKVGTEGSPSVGPPNAPVTVFEFSDYQCPACRQGHETVRKVREMFRGQVRWIFKNYPLQMHKNAEPAAEAALCAADQNRFWDYQDVLFASKEELTAEKLQQFAVDLGLAPDSFKQCFESGKYKSKVEQDIQEARTAGVDRTPTFIINGKLTTGAPPIEQFSTMIGDEIKRLKEKM